MPTQTDPLVLTLCEACGGPDWSALRQALACANLPIAVNLRGQRCMNGCAKPVSLALQGPGRATCFFSGVDLNEDADDIVATLRAYIDAPEGWIEDARPCGRLRFCLVGRVPAL
jgi:predicted metal-binding protein